MGTHKLYFSAEIRKIVYTPVNPSFSIQKWGLRGSKLYRRVFVMLIRNHLSFSTFVFYSQIFTLKLNLRLKVGLTYAISIVK